MPTEPKNFVQVAQNFLVRVEIMWPGHGYIGGDRQLVVELTTHNSLLWNNWAKNQWSFYLSSIGTSYIGSVYLYIQYYLPTDTAPLFNLLGQLSNNGVGSYKLCWILVYKIILLYRISVLLLYDGIQYFSIGLLFPICRMIKGELSFQPTLTSIWLILYTRTSLGLHRTSLDYTTSLACYRGQSSPRL